MDRRPVSFVFVFVLRSYCKTSENCLVSRRGWTCSRSGRSARRAGLGEARFVILRDSHIGLVLFVGFFLSLVNRQSLRLPVDGCGGAGSRTLQVRTCCSISCLVRHVSRRSWLPIQTSQKDDHKRKPIWKQTQTILRHEPDIPELDGPGNWPKSMQVMYDPYPKNDLEISASGWTRHQMHQTGLDLNIV